MNLFRDPLNHPVLLQNGILDIRIASGETCFYCHQSIGEGQELCAVCGFPQKGGTEEQSKFISQKRILRSKRESYRDSLREVRIRLFLLAATFLIMGFVSMLFVMGNAESMTAVLIESGIETLLFTGTAFLCRINYPLGLGIATLLLGLYLVIVVYVFGILLLVGLVGLGINIFRVVLLVMAWRSYIGSVRERETLTAHHIIF